MELLRTQEPDLGAGGAEQRDYLQTPKAGAVSHVSRPGPHSIGKCSTYSAIKFHYEKAKECSSGSTPLTL